MNDSELNTPFKFMSNIENFSFKPKDNNSKIKYNSINKDLIFKSILRQNYQNNEKINNIYQAKANNCKSYFLINIQYFFIVLQLIIYNLNNLFKYLRPSQRIKNFDDLSLELPLSIVIFLLIIKFFTSKRLNLFSTLLFLILPFCAYILINKIIIEKYYSSGFIRYNNILFYDFFKLFFTAFIPFVIFCYLTFIIELRTKVGLITYFISIIYSGYMGGKLLIDYLFITYIIDKKIFKIFHNSFEKDKKKIYFIYFIIYYLISHILNL